MISNAPISLRWSEQRIISEMDLYISSLNYTEQIPMLFSLDTEFSQNLKRQNRFTNGILLRETYLF